MSVLVFLPGLPTFPVVTMVLFFPRLNYFYTLSNAHHASGPGNGTPAGPSGPSALPGGANGTHAATVWQNTTSLLVRALTSLKYGPRERGGGWCMICS